MSRASIMPQYFINFIDHSIIPNFKYRCVFSEKLVLSRVRNTSGLLSDFNEKFNGAPFPPPFIIIFPEAIFLLFFVQKVPYLFLEPILFAANLDINENPRQFVSNVDSDI